MGPNRKVKFDNESPDGKTGEQGVQPVVQGPVGGMKDVGRGNDGEEINLASLSFGSDTEYLTETYVIVDPEVEQNGSLEMESLLGPEIIGAVTSALDEQFGGQRVFFPMFTRYFLAREQSFKMMIEDLLKHREARRNGDPPLVLKDDVLRWRNIANKRMGYLKETYRLFKDKVSETEKVNITLLILYMKMCFKQYHA
jgi:hypothetical protein